MLDNVGNFKAFKASKFSFLFESNYKKIPRLFNSLAGQKTIFKNFPGPGKHVWQLPKLFKTFQSLAGFLYKPCESLMVIT